MPSSDTQFKAGISGNPGGRPKKPKEVAARILLATGDAKEMVEFHRGRMNDVSETYANRSASCDWLMKWGVGEPDPVPADESLGHLIPFGRRDLSPPPEGE